MEARFVRAALLAALVCSTCMGASYRTQNFIVSAQSPQLAQEVCEGAEAFRRDLANDWLGHELPNWPQPCPIHVQAAPNLGAGGATSFVFTGGQPHDFRMSIQGSRERILDSVLPHEVLHTIFATHYGRPLPRWADEGACTIVEHESEKAKQHKLLYQFLTTHKGIPFHQMFAMKEYPPDILPLYAQGYSLARYFVEQGGKRKYVAYVGEGMQTNNWTATTQKYYGHKSLADLQNAWLGWVRQGSPSLQLVSTEPVNAPRNGAAPDRGPIALAAHNAPVGEPSHYASPKGGLTATTPPTHQGVESFVAALARPAPTYGYPSAATAPPATHFASPAPARDDGLFEIGAPGSPSNGLTSAGSPYARSLVPPADEPRAAAFPVATTSPPVNAPGIPWQPPAPRVPPATPAASYPVDQSLSRPSTPQQPKQIILEWSRLPGGQAR